MRRQVGIYEATGAGDVDALTPEQRQFLLTIIQSGAVSDDFATVTMVDRERLAAR